jgi:hypothetical protein
MGVYCYPKGIMNHSKLEFFREQARLRRIYAVKNKTQIDNLLDTLPEHYAVCVVKNVSFDAARVCHPRNEVDYIFNNPDDRPKEWFICSRDWLVEQDRTMHGLPGDRYHADEQEPS